jgi:hypothetical protein
MQENEQYRTIRLLKTIFPGFEDMLEQLYWQDPVFREIAMEIRECIEKQEMIYQETGKRSGSYTETINELEEELLVYLKDDKYSIQSNDEK